MNVEEFKTACHHIVGIIIKYNQYVEKMEVYADRNPGEMKKHFPRYPPKTQKTIFHCLRELETFIIPAITHWNHPQFYAYFPVGNAYPSVLAEMLITGIGSLGYSWESCPALTELELLTLDMYGRLLNLPSSVLYEEGHSKGGGSINNSASDGIYTAMLVARNKMLLKLEANNRTGNPMTHLGKLVAYFSIEAHSCFEKAAILQQIKFRKVAVTEEEHSMTAEELDRTIKEDKANGLVPFFMAGVMGTTGSAAIDDLNGISKLAKKYPDIWYHVDAAFGGSALMLPDFNYLLPALQNVDSINCNPYKWCLVAPDGSAMWVKDRQIFKDILRKDEKIDIGGHNRLEDLSNQAISYSRRFRCLRLWFTLRIYGKNRLQAYLQNHRNLAKMFANYVKNDPLLVLVNKVDFSLVCFRVKETNEKSSEDLTKDLLDRLNKSKKVHLIPSSANDVFYIRVCVNYEFATKETIDFAWNLIKSETSNIVNGVSLDQNKLKTGGPSYDSLDPQEGCGIAFPCTFTKMLGNRETNYTMLDFDDVLMKPSDEQKRT